MGKETMTALAYLRRSKKSDERTISLDVQRASIAAYCAREGLTLVGAAVEDDGVSGSKRARFARINDAVRQAGARSVVAYHLDRLARDTAGILDWMEELTRRGIAVHVVGRGEVEATSAAGRLTVGVEALVADHYRRVISEKTRDALARVKGDGRRFTQHAPYGWRWEGVRRIPDPSRKRGYREEGGVVVREPSEQAVVSRIVLLHAQGLGVRRIARRLVVEHIVTRGGGAWRPTVLARLVRRLPAGPLTPLGAAVEPAVGAAVPPGESAERVVFRCETSISPRDDGQEASADRSGISR